MVFNGFYSAESALDTVLPGKMLRCINGVSVATLRWGISSMKKEPVPKLSPQRPIVGAQAMHEHC